MAFGFSNYQVPQSAFDWISGGNPTTNAGGLVGGVANKINDTTGDSWNWLGNQGILPTAFGGLQALSGVLNGITGMQQLGLANKQYNFAKNAFNAQLGNSITNYGNAAANARRVAYALQGDYAPRAFGTNSQQQAGENYKKEVTNGMVRNV